MKNEDVAVKVLLSITVLPSLLSVLLSFAGIKSYISLIAYGIGYIILMTLKGTKSKINSSVFFILLFFLIFLISNRYTISPQISIEKSENIIYSLFLPIILLFFLFRKKLNYELLERQFDLKIRKFSSLISILFAVLLLLGFTEKGDDLEGRDTIIGMRDAIWCSRFIGYLLLPIIVGVIREKKINAVGLIGLLSALYVMISSGSRGPIFSMLIVIVLLQMPQLKTKHKFLTLFIVFIIYEAFTHLSSRMTSESTEYSNLERLEFLNFVVESKFNLLAGVGIGGFGMAVRGEDIYLYPHNMFLETYIETGLIGVASLIILLIVVYKNSNTKSIWFMYFLYFFINAQVSGDITTNNMLFVFSAIILFVSQRNTIHNKTRNLCIKEQKIVEHTKGQNYTK